MKTPPARLNQAIVRLRRDGLSDRRIAKKLGVNLSVVTAVK
jgi:transposase